MFTKYGEFVNGGLEFLINTLDIERNWYNYFYTDNYISFTSQAGVGQSFLQDKLGRRIMPVTGRGMYIVEGNKGWNLTGLPVHEKCDEYRCVHGLGYTKICILKNDIESEYGILVPDKERENTGYDVMWVKFKNKGNTKRKVQVIAYCENIADGAYTYQGYNTDAVSYDGRVNGIHFLKNYKWNDSEEGFEHFLVCGQELSGYDCARNAFIGTYGSITEPQALHKGGCTNSDCIAEKFGFAVQSEVELEPGETGFVSFASGVASDINTVNEITEEINSDEKINDILKKLYSKYNEIIDGVKIDTPDSNLNSLFNYWLKYQTNMGSRWARVRHNGYRDIVSDTECLSVFNPKLAWERIKRILTYQYSNGYAPRTFLNGEIRDNNFADCTVWITFAVYAIINELGDISLLQEQVEFNDGTVASVYEHIKKSVDFLYNFRGNHNLIQIWGGDWNDCMNKAGLEHKGVSVWLTMAWYRANSQLSKIAEMIEDKEQFLQCQARGEEIRDIVDEYGWDTDGGYYIYAYSDDDYKIGASSCKEGSVYLNPQLWAVLSGIAVAGKDVIAMENAEKLLTYELGTAVSTPAYTKYVPYIGSMTQKAPGVQENGGVYLHAMCWKLAADAMLGRNDIVERDINRILPFNNPIVNGDAEPYTLCNCYMGRETGYRYGKPGQSWRTASGQWFVKALVQYVFGFEPTLAGIEMNPCMPKSWSGAKVEKKFRGCVYNVEYINTGTVSITVDGIKIDGKLLPCEKGKVYNVKVEY